MAEVQRTNTHHLNVSGYLSHAGLRAGFYGNSPVERPANYTQTYDAASRIHSNLTSAAVSDGTGESPDLAVESVADAATNRNFSDLADQHNKTVADLANTKQVLNQVIDDLQRLGLLPQ